MPLITGGDPVVGRSGGNLNAREGANVAITHLGEGEDAELTQKTVENEGRKCV